MTNNRPHGRKRGETTASGDVHKREQVKGKQGSVKEQPKQNAPRQESPERGSFRTQPVRATQMFTRTRRGGGGGLTKLILFLILAFLLYTCLTSGIGSGGTSAVTPTPAAATPTAQTATPKPVTPGTFAASFQQPTTTYNHNTSTSTVNTEVASGAREKFTQLLGNGKDTVTILVYMCATDLESNYAMATNDLNEMLYAQTGDKVNVIIETGGTKQWRNNVMSARTNQRFRIANGQLEYLDRNVGMKQMTDPRTLVDFINYGVKNFPASRYMLILWDQGSGSVQGYGYDQNFPNATMTLDELYQALGAVNTKFDVIGFDACLMANTETAVAVAPYADYLIASEETEPGTGWYYTNWLSALGSNTSMPTIEVGKQIIDDFIKDSSAKSRTDKTSLSLVDLAEFSAEVPAKLTPFAQNITQTINSSDYRSIANARSVTKEFAQSNRIDQVDLVHFCQNVNTKEAQELANAVKNCVKYNRTNNMNNAYGLSIYFPYYSANRVNTAAKIYNAIGMDEAYTGAIRSFANIGAAGQVVNNSTSSSLFDLLGGSSSSNGTTISTEDLLGLLLGGQQAPAQTAPQGGSGYYGYGGSYGGYPSSSNNSVSSLVGGSDALDQAALELFANLLFRSSVDNEKLQYAERNGQTVLVLDEDTWKEINRLELNVWVDDGAGYIDLGQDNIFEFDDEGTLIVDYDGRWVCLDGQPVAYYMLSDEYESDDEYTTTGFVPAEVTHNVYDEDGNTVGQVTEDMHILIEYSDDEPDGIILGGQIVYEDEDVETKGLYKFEDGDQINFVCDYYDYKGNFEHAYYMSEPITVDGELEVGVYQIEGQRLLYSYVLTDTYNAKHWTPIAEYK